MADRGIYGAPYDAVRQLVAWTEIRKTYLRGRALLAGWRWDDLDGIEQIDFAFVSMFEPMLSGSTTTVDEMFDRWDQAILNLQVEQAVDIDEAIALHGTGPQDLAAAQAAYDLMPAAPRVRSEEPTPEDQ